MNCLGFTPPGNLSFIKPLVATFRTMLLFATLKNFRCNLDTVKSIDLTAQ